MRYATPAAFKDALEHRLRESFPGAVDRARQLVVFSRFLARVVPVLGHAAVLKGGLALELRLERARTTKDIDLALHAMPGSRDHVLERLQEAARLDLGDFLVFGVEPDPEHPDIENDALRYDGYRFRVSCRLAGKQYGRPFFGVDVVLGEPLLGDPDELVMDDWLGFAELSPPRVRVYPVETHIAEKLHAYTMPRERPNSRMKDLPDLALLGTIAALDRERLRSVISGTFRFRATHETPRSIPEPPPDWSARYAQLATREALRWRTLPELVERVRAFIDPVLGPSMAPARWDLSSWSWLEME